MMGQGIAYVSAMSGIEVVLLDMNLEAAERGKGYSQKLLDKRVSKGSMTKEVKKADSHLIVLKGNLAPEGSVAKITGKEGLHFKGTARVYASEENALTGILNGEVVAGEVIVIRYEGPKGGPGMREMLSLCLSS